MSRDLPPGCSVNDIPGNRPEDIQYEAETDAILDALFAESGLPEDERGEIVRKMLRDAEARAVADYIAEQRMAEEYHPAPTITATRERIERALLDAIAWASDGRDPHKPLVDAWVAARVADLEAGRG